MYFSGLYKTLRDLEEKKFYDIALLFLSIKGYPNLEIIDGKGDGGRDVSSSWNHIRIQLSVKDWEKKINHEASLAVSANSNHSIYVTNRRINIMRDKFLQEEFKHKGKIEVTIFDIASISTSLSLPGSIDSVNTILGLPITGKIEASPKEIAISNTLLFSSEAKELKDEIIENCILANIFSDDSVSESSLIERTLNDLGSQSLSFQIVKSINRLKSKGKIKIIEGAFTLSSEVRGKLKLSRDDFEQAKSKDLNELMRYFNLDKKSAELLINISLEILSENSHLMATKHTQCSYKSLLLNMVFSGERASLLGFI